MSRYGYQEMLVALQVDGVAVTGTTPTSLFGTSVTAAAAKYTLPAGVLQIGSVLRVTAKGRISNIVTTPGTLTLDVRFGSVIVFNGGAMQLNAVAKTNVSWIFDAMLTVRAIGSGTTANLLGIGQWTSESVVGSPLPSVGGSGTLLCPASAPAVGTGFDSTAAQLVDLFAAFSLTGNSIACHEYGLELMN